MLCGKVGNARHVENSHSGGCATLGTTEAGRGDARLDSHGLPVGMLPVRTVQLSCQRRELGDDKEGTRHRRRASNICLE